MTAERATFHSRARQPVTAAGATSHSHRRHIARLWAPHVTATGATFHSHRRHISQTQAPHATATGATFHSLRHHYSQPSAPHFTAAGAAHSTATGATFHRRIRRISRHLSAHQKPLTMYVHASTMLRRPDAAQNLLACHQEPIGSPS
eukprot:3239821-Pyramimonas_sp.AAC.1